MLAYSESGIRDRVLDCSGVLRLGPHMVGKFNLTDGDLGLSK